MSGFSPSGHALTALDPRKRVNYQLGLVLGEDEFRQDQLHHRERDHHATRALHGYGTVSGLAVTFDDGEVRIAPGLAVDPAGHLICVPVEHCANLNAWLAGHAEALEADDEADDLPASMSISVVLCWTECATDQVPIPTDSCLPADEARAASRMMDSFELRFTTEPPPPVGEVGPGDPDDLASLIAELHDLFNDPGGVLPDPADVDEMLRAWAVERRPEVAAGTPCLPTPDEICVLLGQVDFDVDASGAQPIVVDPVVDDTARPILVSTRLLQEAIFALGADIDVPVALDDLTDVDLSGGPSSGEVLTFDGTSWVAEAPSGGGGGGGVTEHGDLNGLDADDHPHYLLVDGTRALEGDLSAAGFNLTDLPSSTAEGQPVVDGQAAGGDLSGTYPSPQVSALAGMPLSGTGELGDVLMLGAGGWSPGQPMVLPFASIQPLQARRYEIWFNLDTPANRIEVLELTEESLVIHRETDSGPSFLRQVGPGGINRVARNVFIVEVQQDPTPLRFTFTPSAIRVSTDPGDRFIDTSTIRITEELVSRANESIRTAGTDLLRGVTPTGDRASLIDGITMNITASTGDLLAPTAVNSIRDVVEREVADPTGTGLSDRSRTALTESLNEAIRAEFRSSLTLRRWAQLERIWFVGQSADDEDVVTTFVRGPQRMD